MGNVVSTFNHLDKSGPEYHRLFPPILQTQNKKLIKGGPLALYESSFLISFEGLFLQLLFWGMYSGLVGFSMKRMMDFHYLSITFAWTFLLITIHFLTDLELNSGKLIFFSQHVGIEFLIAIRVLAPPSILRRWTGHMFFVVWLVVVGSTGVIASNNAVYFAAAMACLSDLLMCISGLVLMTRKLRQRHASQPKSRKLTAEAISGLGYFLHGLSALPNTAIVVLLLRTQEPPSYFGMVWTAVAIVSLLSGGLQLPVAGIYFKNVTCCCNRRQKISQGDIDWEECMYEEEMVVMKGNGGLQRNKTSASSEVSLMPANMYTIHQTPQRKISFHAQ